MNRSLDDLNLEFRTLLQKFIIECQNVGVKVLIYNTLRTKEEQYALYLQGRAPVKKVNEARKKAGLPPISSSENRVVTNLRDSPHCHGLAADFVPVVDGKVVWNDHKLWAICGKIAERVGLEWGGSWKDFPDYPHLQMKNWRRFLKNGKQE